MCATTLEMAPDSSALKSGCCKLHPGAHGLDLAYPDCVLLRWHGQLLVHRIRGIGPSRAAGMPRTGSEALNCAMSSVNSRHRS